MKSTCGGVFLSFAAFIVSVAPTWAATTLYITNPFANTVYLYDGDTGVSQGFFGTTGGGTLPFGIQVRPDNGNVYVGLGDRINVYNSAGAFQFNLDAVDNKIDAPAGLDFDGGSNLYAANSGAVVFSPERRKVPKYDSSGSLVGQTINFERKNDLVIGPGSDVYAATNEATLSIRRFDGATLVDEGAFVAGGTGGLGRPRALDFGPDGNLYVMSEDTSNSSLYQVLRYNGVTGTFIDVFIDDTGPGWDFGLNGDLVWGPNGDLYISSYDIYRFDSTGALVGSGPFIANGTGTSFSAMAFTPIPEPGSLSLLLLAAGTITATIARRRTAR